MTQSNLSAIRCTVNPASIFEEDLLAAADEIRDYDAGEHAVLTADLIAEICCLPEGHDAITPAVVRACQI